MQLTEKMMNDLHLNPVAERQEMPNDDIHDDLVTPYQEELVDPYRPHNIPVPQPRRKRDDYYYPDEPPVKRDTASISEPSEPDIPIIKRDERPPKTEEQIKFERLGAILTRENAQKRLLATKLKLEIAKNKLVQTADKIGNTEIPVPNNISFGNPVQERKTRHTTSRKSNRTTPPIDYFGNLGGCGKEQQDFIFGGQDLIFGGMGYNHVTHIIPSKKSKSKQAKQQVVKPDNDYDPFGFGGLGGVSPKSVKAKTVKGKAKPAKAKTSKPSGQPPYRLGGGIF